MKKKITNKYQAIDSEKKILEFWEDNNIVKKYLKKNDSSEKYFSFIDGPITANNKMGVHHGWGRTIKDTVQRYYNMKGYRQRFQNGFDGQGLWVEVNVEKDLGLNSKKDIEDYGLDKFSKKCRSRVEKYSDIITNQSQQLGQFMDWQNSYQTMSDNNIEHIWNFLKVTNTKKLLYLGERVLPWCRRCGTSLSSHELHDNYKQLTHTSVFIKYQLKDSDDYLLVWTTTPWTLLANVAAAVDPNLTYVKITTEQDGNLILAEDLLEVIEDEYQIVEKIKGKELVGRQYQGLFDNFDRVNTEHKIVAWDDVGGDEGTGIVHIAPGCGGEDFELAKENDLSVIGPIDEEGNYLDGFGKYSGKAVSGIEKEIIADLEDRKALYKTQEYKHRYPLCWRCDEELVYRVVKEWFIKADPVRKEMKEQADRVDWNPDSSGKRMQDWLDNMSDWNISRKRYWGLPLPFYPCSKCKELTVVGSRAELERLAVDKNRAKNLPELHRPWIDEVKINCPNCKTEISRVSEVGDCWLDAGIVPYSTLKYSSDKEYWRNWFPADFISEMKEQVRLWFYSMLFMSVVLESKAPYKQVLTYSPVNDEKGEEMHKSKGNAIWFDDAVKRMGADVMRWIYLAQNPNYPLRFGYGRSKEIGGKFNTWWNSLYFLTTYAKIDSWQPSKDVESFEPTVLLDRWMLSRLSQFISQADKSYKAKQTNNVIDLFDSYLDDLSNWYIRRSRRRFWADGKDQKDKISAYNTLYLSLLKSAQVMAPALPFISERIYGILKLEDSPNSVHLTDYPEINFQPDSKLIEEMARARSIVEKALSTRAKEGIKVRQPLASLNIKESGLNPEILEIIKDEVNVKEIKQGQSEFRLNSKITRELKLEGISREIIRQVQSLRKKAELDFDDRIRLNYQTDSSLLNEVFNKYGQKIQDEVLAENGLSDKKSDNCLVYELTEIDGEQVWLGIDK